MSEIFQFKEFVKDFIVSRSDFGEEEEEAVCFKFKMYKLIIKEKLTDAFPNISVLLSIYLTLMTTNCTCERSFSNLKLIRNRLRALMVQDRLNDLSIMSIESDLLRKLSYDDIINEFAERKSRKVLL